MPFIQRYSDVKKGGIIFCGNTLGLSKAADQNAPGTEGWIGAFTSLDTSLQVGAFHANTTLDNTPSTDRSQTSLCPQARQYFTPNLYGADSSVPRRTTFPH